MNNKILAKLLNNYKQGLISEVEFKLVLVELGMMEKPSVIKTDSISMNQLSQMNEKVVLIIK